jgi:Zn-dependent alcohol dehydrogenase
LKGFRIVFSAPKEINIEEFDVKDPSENEVLIETINTLISN